MLKVTLVFETKSSKLMFRNILPRDSRKIKCLIFGEITRRFSGYLKEKKVEIIPRQEYSKAQREEYLREYIDLIGALGQEQDSFLWWATDISSKNRFTSKLPLILQQYIEVIDVIKNDDCEHIIVINPLSDLLPALERFLEDSKISFSCYGNLLQRRLGRAVFRIKKVLSVIYNAGRFYLRAVYARWHLGKLLDAKLVSGQQWYVVKSFIYNHSFSKNGDYKDAFFGSLPDYLSKQKSVIIFANILGDFRFCIKKIKVSKSFPIVPIEVFVSLPEVLKGVRRALFQKMKGSKEILFYRRNVSEIIRDKLESPFIGIQAGQLLHYWGTKGLLRKITPEKFLLSYENNPWEKMCMLALREDSPNTKIIAYQHNVVPQASTNMFVSQKEKAIIPKPDLVLTTGEIPKRIMESYGSLNGGMIRSSCALRHEYLFQIPKRPYHHGRTILLALEGIFEVYELINYVLEELYSYPNYKIVIRTHPVYPFERLQHKINSRLHHLNNISLSEGRSLQEDIENSDIVIYWGSTVAMESLWMGKPVIHFDNGSILSFDPLFDCSYLKWTVRRGDILINTLKEIESLSQEQYEDQRENARVYLGQYFYPVIDDRLSKFVN